MSRLSFALGVAAALCVTAPAAAQLDLDDDPSSVQSPLTSAEQAVLFDQGVDAYDAENYQGAFEIWLPLAQRGNMSAQRNVGHLLRRGLGVEQDLPRAVYFYRRAARSGLVSAMVNLSAMLRAGQGVDEPNYTEAAQWLYLAAQAGDPRAQYVLGVMAARGQGMNQNRELAVHMFRLSAEQGLREARERLNEAGLELSNIGDEVERPEFSLPPELAPLPDIGLGAELSDVAIPPLTAPRPEQNLAQPAPTLRRAPAQAGPDEGSSAAPITAPITTPVTQPATEPQTEPEPEQTAAPAPSQPAGQVPTVQRVSQPTSTTPPTPATSRQPEPTRAAPATPTPEPEPEEEENPMLQRLLGGTQ